MKVQKSSPKSIAFFKIVQKSSPKDRSLDWTGLTLEFSGDEYFMVFNMKSYKILPGTLKSYKEMPKTQFHQSGGYMGVFKICAV